MSRNIVLLSDGTGNSSSKLFKTNVWRLFQALDLQDVKKQIAYYDDGVGTSSFKLFAILGGIFGFGLKRNIIDIYSFCCRNYKPDDKIFGFGFSRGAFTIRVVAGFIANVGLIEYDGNEAHLARDTTTAYRAYRKGRSFRSGRTLLIGPLRALRDWVSHTIFRNPKFENIKRIEVEKIHFLGVWDTVDAYGGPIEEITRAIDYWYWPLSMPDRFMNHKITRACHALALEEERDAFQPVLWDDRYVREGEKLVPVDHRWQPEPSDAAELADIDRERISQVWFVGVHSDVGGGYAREGLAYQTLDWMMTRAAVYGLSYLKSPSQQGRIKDFVGPYDKLNDSRHGFAGYYRYRPRKLSDIYKMPPYRLSVGEDLLHILDIARNRPDPEREVRAELGSPDWLVVRPTPKIHQSVFDRITDGNDGYAPIVLPQQYNVVKNDGAIVPSEDVEPESASRANRQEKVWDWVWARRITYFLTVFASLYLAAMPLIEKWKPGRGPASPAEIIVPVIDVIGAFLPNFVKPWLDAFRQSPGRFLIGVLLLAILIVAGGWMQGKIRDLMRAIWRDRSAQGPAPDAFVYRLRSAGPYRAFFYLLKHWILPAIFALMILLVLGFAGVSLVNRVSFALFDVAGQVCTSQAAQPVTANTAPKPFETRTLCAATALAVEKGRSYRVTLVVTDPWEDGHKFKEPDAAKAKGIETGPQGFGFEKMIWKMWFGLPFRRLIASNWFVPILRVGNTGFGEIVLPFERNEPPQCLCPATTSYAAKFKARKSGEVFVYVNDAVIGIPGYFGSFYENNKGKADLTLQLLPDE